MGAPRGDAAVTRQVILASARDLFAARGVHDVSVRQIAAAAGVNHALVHRYFGTKDEMVAEIIMAEARTMAGMAKPDADMAVSLRSLGDAFGYLLTEGRTSLLLMMRAELDGLAPERMIEGSPLRPLRMLADWLERQGGGRAAPADPRVVAMVLGAAIMGLAAMQPMLMAGGGLEGEDPDDVLRRCVDTAVALAAVAVGAGDGYAGGPARAPAR